MAAFNYEPIVPRDVNIYRNGAVSVPEKASQTFKRGTPLKVDASNYAETVAADFTTGLLWIAAEDAHNTTADGDQNILAWPVRAYDQWYASLEDAISLADFPEAYGLKKDTTTGFWIIDEAELEDQVNLIERVGEPAGPADSDTKGRVIIRFLTSAIDLD